MDSEGIDEDVLFHLVSHKIGDFESGELEKAEGYMH